MVYFNHRCSSPKLGLVNEPIINKKSVLYIKNKINVDIIKNIFKNERFVFGCFGKYSLSTFLTIINIYKNKNKYNL